MQRRPALHSTKPTARGWHRLGCAGKTTIRPMFFAQHLPHRFLPIHCQPVTGPMIHRHCIAPLQYNVSHGCAPMLRRASIHQHQVTIRRRTRTGPESAKSLLPEIIQRHPIVTAAQGSNGRDSCHACVRPERRALGCFPNTCPGTPNRALCGQGPCRGKAAGGRLLPSAVCHLRLARRFKSGIVPRHRPRASTRGGVWTLKRRARSRVAT